MNPELSATVLAAHGSRSRVVRGGDGVIRLLWCALGVEMGQAEFVALAGVVEEAAGCALRRGELARGSCGRVTRSAMGQVALSHGSLTLWFAPEEFEEFGRLVGSARCRLADAAPLPFLGVPWEPREEPFGSN